MNFWHTLKIRRSILLKDFSIIEQEFIKIKYKIKFRVLNSADYGVPQKRQRVIILGSPENNILPDFPKVTHTKNSEKNLTIT